MNFIGEFEKNLARRGAAAATSTASSAATSTTPPRGILTAFNTSTPATGWKAAPAVGETASGELELVRWLDVVRAVEEAPVAEPEALKVA